MREKISPVPGVWRRLARRPLALAALAYLAVDIAYFGAQSIPDIGRTCACRAGADPTSYMWFLAWWPHALLHGMNPFVTHVLFAPGATNLGAVDVVPGAAILVSPITLLFGPLVAYNVLALAAPVLAAFFAFLLCRYVSGSTLAGLVGGYIYGFSPYMLGHMQGHLDLLMIFPIPAAVHLTLALIDGRISRRAYVPWMALALGFLFLSQPELTLTFVLLGACAFVVALALVPGQRARISAAVVPVAVAGLLAIMATSVFVYYALTGPLSSGFFGGYSNTYVADALGFVVPTPVVRLGRTWFSVVSGQFTGGTPENGVYIGAVLALVLARHVITRWRSAATRVLLVMFVLVVVLMLGPQLHIVGQPTIPMPWRLVDRLPLLDHVAPVRMAIYMFLILALIVAIWLGQERPGRAGVAKWLLAAAAVLTLVPNLGSGLWHSRIDNPPLFTTSAYRSVVRPGEIVLPLPFAIWGSSMLWQAETDFNFRIADGYVGALLPPGYARDLGVLSSPQIQPRPAELAAFLAARHVSTVLVGARTGGIWPQVLAALGLRPRLVDGVLVYELPGRSPPAAPTAIGASRGATAVVVIRPWHLRAKRHRGSDGRDRQGRLRVADVERVRVPARSSRRMTWMLSSRLRRAADRALDRAGNLADRRPMLARWRSERFSQQVVRRMPGLAVDGANGVRYFVRPQDSAIGAAIIRDGAFESHKIAAVLALLRAHDVEIDHVVDVGANIGTTTIELLRQRPDVSGTAFEPEPTNFLLLQMNLIANGLERRVRTQRAAIGDCTGELTLELADSNFGDHRVRLACSLGEDAFAEAVRRTIRVPGLRLDDAENLNVDGRTVVFVDVQGFEGHVLSGARRVLECRPPLVVELWPYGLDRSGGREAMFDGLARYDRLYDVGAPTPRPVSQQDLEALAESISRQPTGHTDLLALAA